MATTKRDEKNAAAVGDNADRILMEYVEKVAKFQDQIDTINGKMKDTLNAAKKDGFLKTSIKEAIKNLRMTKEQWQSKKEIHNETMRITKLCSDLPLFAKNEEDDQKEAA